MIKWACVVISGMWLRISWLPEFVIWAEFSSSEKGIISSEGVLVINLFGLKSHSSLSCSKKINYSNDFVSS